MELTPQEIREIEARLAEVDVTTPLPSLEELYEEVERIFAESPIDYDLLRD